jgi:ATP-dependent DNA helicase DinG
VSVTVEQVLGPGGALEVALQRYEHRPEQLRVAQAVEAALEAGEVLLAEAGTGTGKTLAYLVPAALSGKKVVVSTATRNLQDQVFFKDIPLLQDRVGLQFRAALLKGRSNYLCLQRFESFDREPSFAERADSAAWPRVRAWAMATETGDRGELELPEGSALWTSLSVTADSCLGPKCPQYEPCFVTRARRAAEEADVVVVNHHLFFADLVLKGKAREGGVLPAYEAVVFDEAHAVEDVATSWFGTSVSSFRVEDLVRDALRALPAGTERGKLLAALALQLRGRGEAFFRAVGDKLRLQDGATAQLSADSFVGTAASFSELQQSLEALNGFAGEGDEPEVAPLGRRAGELSRELGFIHAAEGLDHVFWAEGRGRGLFLKSAPIEVAQSLKARLYDELSSVVFTSATLAPGGRFEFLGKRLGLRDEEGMPTRPLRELQVASPFDYPRQAALYVPRGLPEPASPAFVEAAAEELLRLAHVTGGRAFFLFTSLRNMREAHGLLRNRLPWQVLLQGERPKGALLQAFQEEPSVLFASASFWEGVDVPGEALSLVAMDKLPFASPGDPLVAARIRRMEQRGEEPFGGYQLPQAALALKQGFGRLIRTRDDRGIVAILDSRLHARSYGRALVASLPPARRIQQLDALERWFRGE